MALQLIKFEVTEAWSSDTWAVIDTNTDRMLRLVFFDELQALIFVAYIERWALKHDIREQQRIADLILNWLNVVAPLPGRLASERRIPAAWAAQLVDTSYWDEEAFAKIPIELQQG